MNLIDMAILAIIGLGCIIGLYNGFIRSILNVFCFFISWFIGIIFNPILSKYIFSHSTLFNKLIFYSEGSARIPSLEQKMLAVSSLTKDQIYTFVKNAKLPPIFNKALTTNLLNKSIPDITTVGQYFDYTIAAAIVNILSIFIIFIIVRIILLIGISIYNEAKPFPVFKKYDGLLAAASGAIRGILFVTVLFAFISAFLAVAPIDKLIDLINSSNLGRLFYNANSFVSTIKGAF